MTVNELETGKFYKHRSPTYYACRVHSPSIEMPGGLGVLMEKEDGTLEVRTKNVAHPNAWDEVTELEWQQNSGI